MLLRYFDVNPLSRHLFMTSVKIDQDYPQATTATAHRYIVSCVSYMSPTPENVAINENSAPLPKEALSLSDLYHRASVLRLGGSSNLAVGFPPGSRARQSSPSLSESTGRSVTGVRGGRRPPCAAQLVCTSGRPGSR